MVQDQPEHRRDSGDRGDAMLANRVHHSLRFEAGQQIDRTASRDEQCPRHDAADVKQRHEREIAPAGLDEHPHLAAVGDERDGLLRQDHAFRQARGAPGVHQHRRLIVVGFGRNRAGCLHRHQVVEAHVMRCVGTTDEHDSAKVFESRTNLVDDPRKRLVDEQHRRARVVQDVHVFVGRQTTVEWVDDRRAEKARVPELDVFVARPGKNADAVGR